MKKSLVKTLITTLCFATVGTGAVGFVALKNKANAVVPSTDGSTPTEAVTDALVAPLSYEQYLPLSAPSDVALSDRYLAVADGNVIYLYDKQDEKYHEYKHDPALLGNTGGSGAGAGASGGGTGSNAQENVISKMQFSSNGNLYYAVELASGDNFYEIDLSEGHPDPTKPNERYTVRDLDNISCSTFTIDGETLYFANATGVLYSYLLSDDNATPTLLRQSSTSSQKETLAFANGDLYYLDNNKYLNKINVASPADEIFYASFPINLKCIAIVGNTLSCTTENKEFFAYSLSELFAEKDATEVTPLSKAKDSYSALASHADYVYAVNGSVIEQFSVTDNAFTEYSVCSASDAPNRLNGATDIHLVGEKLYIADAGNRRLSVYDAKTQQFETNFPITFAPKFLSSDGETLLLANASKAEIYSLSEDSYGELIGSFTAFNGELKGATSVFGTHYLLSDGYAYSLTETDGEWKLTAQEKRPSRFTSVALLSSDIYGDLYFVSKTQTETDVYRITEQDFMSPDGEGTVVVGGNLPSDIKKISVDYNRTVYVLSKTEIHVHGRETKIPFDKATAPLVYVPVDKEVSLTAFAIGVEENQTYLLCEGNYLMRSTRLQLPTVKTIPVGNAETDIFSETSAEFTVVDTKENALLISFDLEELKGETYFPYAGYQRSKESKTALKLGTAGAYSVLAVFDETDNAYHTYLTLSEFCTPHQDEYREVYEERKTGYITSDVTLYKFPYLTQLLTVGELARGTKIQILGEVTQLDHEYYHVLYETADDVSRSGYIPKSYVSETSGFVPEEETVVEGNQSSNRDAVWRLVYLLLGLLAIVILVNYLLLRKKK